MVKVLRIINRFNLGGPTYNVAYLSKYMPNNVETILVGGIEDETEASSDFIINNLGLKPIIIDEMRRSINLKNDYTAYRKIKKIIQEYQPDIVHTHASKAGTLGRLAAFSCKVPIIVHTFHGHVFHSYFGKLQTIFYKNIERFLAKRTSAIIAISEKQKQELSDIHKIAPKDKIQIIPLGFDLLKFHEHKENKRKKFRDRYQVDDEEIVISIIGRLVPVKNHELFLKSLKNVADKTSKKIRAFIVGDGENRDTIESLAKALNIPFGKGETKDEVRLLTFTSWIKEIDEVLAGSDIIALTSFNEGTPVSLIEAQAANVPIVTTNTGGIENIVIPNKTAILCKNNDVADFSKHLLWLVENEQERIQMSQQGWTHVHEKYHYTRLVTDMYNLYGNLLKNSP